MICSEVFFRACRVLRDLIIISHFLSFVKRFLKSFLKNFSGFFQKLFNRSFHPAELCPTIISHSLAFVKRFFKSFFNFFRDFLSGLSHSLALRGRSLTAQLPDSLHIIALLPPFVKRFLTSFLNLEIRCGLYKTRALRLYTMPTKCQFLSQIGECAGSVMLIFHALTPSRRTSAF